MLGLELLQVDAAILLATFRGHLVLLAASHPSQFQVDCGYPTYTAYTQNLRSK